MPLQHQLDLVKRALALYAGDHVLERVLSLGGSALELGGEVQFATVAFVDVTKMVPAAERFDWPIVTEAISQYLSVVVKATAASGSRLDAPIGDAAICYWIGDGHADRACECALSITMALAASDAIPKVIPKIGIHSGRVLIGNAGSRERMRFTVTGAAVNTASGISRMAPVCEEQPIVLSEATRQLLVKSFSLQPMEPVPVKGLDSPLGLFGLVGQS